MFTLGYTITAIFDKLGLVKPVQEAHSHILLATKLPSWIFSDDEKDRELFEDLFNVYDNDVSVIYFPTLHRARITFADIDSAVACKRELQGIELDGSNKLCLSYTYLGYREHHKLAVPETTKQFLISPPSSPPVGWEPVIEMEPHVDEHLLAAIEKLGGQDLRDEELMLIPQQEEISPAVTLKMSQSQEENKENDENLKGQSSNVTRN